jgi:MOSC domain-containing protein YiiM
MQQYAQPGRVVWLGVRPASRQPVLPVAETYARSGTGLDGDRYRGRPDSKRQVTLIQAEHLLAVASYLGRDSLDPALVRRNIVVEGINLLALKDKTFRIGDAVLAYTGECHPCSRMEEVLAAAATMPCASTAALPPGYLLRVLYAWGTRWKFWRIYKREKVAATQLPFPFYYF